MILRFLRFLLLSLTVIITTITSKSSAFVIVPNTIIISNINNNNKVSSSFSSSSSSSSSSSLGSSVVFETEDDGRYLYSRAQNCVNADDDEECPLDEAQTLLQQLLRIQANCDASSITTTTDTDTTTTDTTTAAAAADTVSNNILCKDVHVAAEIIAKLRTRISTQHNTSSSSLMMVASGGNLLFIPKSYWPMIFLILFSVLITIIHFGQDHYHNNVSTIFMMVEDVDDIINEYFSTHDLPEAYFRNGPLF